MEERAIVGTSTKIAVPDPVPVPVLDRYFDAWDGDPCLLLGCALGSLSIGSWADEAPDE